MPKTMMFILLIFLTATLWAQYKPSSERSDPKQRRKTDIDGNNVRTTIFNTGLTGRQNYGLAGQTPYEWPKNTGRHYVAMTQIFVAGEVRDTNNNRIHIVDVPYSRSGSQGKSWTIEPVPGYCNPDTNNTYIAKSDIPSSWPEYWPDKMTDLSDPGWKGSWNGYFGKNIFNADQEMYFRAADDLYDRYLYFPHRQDDPNRRGLGILIDCRVLAWSQILVSDVIYLLYEIRNDSYYDLPKTAFCIWIADMVGGDGDTEDDSPVFDISLDIAWCKDKDGQSKNAAFAGVEVGVAGVAFLETPGNAADGIDNDGDGEDNSPKITDAIIEGEDQTDLIDNNGNGLIDENETHVPFGSQSGVGFRDHIDNDGDGESGSPVITQAMLAGEIADNGKDDNLNNLYDEGTEDLGLKFKDLIDNNDNGENLSPVVTQAMLEGEIPDNGRDDNGNGLIDEDQQDLGKKYADGIDNDADGAIDEEIDEGIDEMIDESREDHIDNDGDWDITLDDVGLDGNAFTGDPGENDAKPTSGAGTFFPGEPNIDKTDVSESDQIGLTNVQYVKMGNFHNENDETNWNMLMIPGKFFDMTTPITGDWDAFVSSGFFPIQSGAIERISVAVILGENDESVVRKKRNAQKTYDTDYQFAKAPFVPVLRAVAGDGVVHLYWDDEAEQSYDDFLAEIGEDPYDFEGYRLYRTTDPGRLDDFDITNAYGDQVYHKPIMICDKVDQWSGLHPLHYNGAHFNLGENTGLSHSFVDSTVQNGVTYYYTLTSFDYGSVVSEILPSECPVMLSIKSGKVIGKGQNVAIVTPTPPAAGYVPAQLESINHTRGSANGSISYSVIDQDSILHHHTYEINFEDTIIVTQKFSETVSTIKTKNFSIEDITDPANRIPIILKSTAFEGQEIPIFNGLSLTLLNESSIQLNSELSRWNHTEAYQYALQLINYPTFYGVPRPADYQVIFDEVGVDTSILVKVKIQSTTREIPAIPVNFKVYNISENRFIDFAFLEQDLTDGAGRLTADASGLYQDKVIFMETLQDSLRPSWLFTCFYNASRRAPMTGDTAFIYTKKPFTSRDTYQFTVLSDSIDTRQAKSDMDRIRVVPNPYIVAATWEPTNPYNSGRGPQEIHFIHLPRQCTIRIYTVNGERVAQIEHNSANRDGTAVWNLLTLDNLAASYGIYIYHIEAPGLGEKIGKFAIIK
ncbi:MAG: hypothetical protein KBA26_04655 [Candidatus Delongbacteria bacterium]|nr:hypothetical protein [Candidatus Delongbacteria bacterium]